MPISHPPWRLGKACTGPPGPPSRIGGEGVRTRAPADLAARIGRSSRYVAELVEDCRERGLVEQDGSGGWRLTREAERRYGEALRGLRDEDAVHDPELATHRRVRGT